MKLFSTYVKEMNSKNYAIPDVKYREYLEYITDLDLNVADNRAILYDYLNTMSELSIRNEQLALAKSRETEKLVSALETLKTNPTTGPSVTVGPSSRSLIDFQNNDHASANVSTNIDLNKLVIKPDKFDGTKPSPREWITKFINSIEANGWSEATAIKYFPHFLTSSATKWYDTDVKNKISSWNDITKLFESNYLGQADRNALCKELRIRYQKEGEYVATFIPDYRYLLLQVAPDTSEQEQIRQVTEKLLPVYKKAIAMFVPASLVELRNVCLRVETTFVAGGPRRENTPRQTIANRSVQKPNYGNNRNTLNKNSSDKTKPKIACRRCGFTSHSEESCFSTKHKDGHELKPNNAPRPPRPDVKKVNMIKESAPVPKKADNKVQQNNVETTNAMLTKWNRSQSVKQCNLNYGNACIDKLIKHPIRCGDYELTALVDPGANITVMHLGIARALKLKVTRTAPDAPFMTGPSSEPLTCPGTVTQEVQLTLNGITKSKLHRIPLVKNLTQDMLLGMDLLKAFRIIVDTESGTISFKQPGIVSATDHKIPPRSQCFIEAVADHIGTLMTTPSDGLGLGDLVVGNVINDATPATKVLVLNPSEKEITLPSGKQISQYETMDKTRIEVNHIVDIKGTNEVAQVGDSLNKNQILEISKLLTRNKKAFSIDGSLGMTNIVEHKIELEEGTKPFACPLRRRPPLHIEETRKQIKAMKETGLIEDSSSPWASAYVLAKKKNGEFRLCIDYRKLNSATKRDMYPLPNIEECLDSLSGKKYFSIIDFNSGFWQIRMEKKSKELTAFRTEDGHFQFTRMPFGLTNAPASFQKMVNALLAGLRGLNLQVFIDDVCVATNRWSEHLEMLQKVFTLVINANLTLKANKCIFGANHVTFLGHEISEQGIKQDPNKMRAMNELPPPKDVSGVRCVLGMFSYYRKFVPNFAAIASPITQLLRKGESFKWGNEQQEAFDKIKSLLAVNATLAHFNHEDPIMVKTDASHKGVAGMLLQQHDGVWRLVYCCSRRLSSAESNYGITDLEGLAIVYTLQKLRPYLLGKRFVISTDHCALCVLNKTVEATKSSRLQRWRIILSEYDYHIEHTKGDLHKDIDCLSRAPVDAATDEFLEDKVYHVALPIDRKTWIQCYNDNESEMFLARAEKEQEGFSLLSGVIYSDNLLYVPESKRCEILTESHSSPTAGHGGLEVTLARMERYWWPTLREDTKEWIKSCDECQRRKVDRTRPAGSMYHFEAYSPLELVCLDTIGPLAQTPLRNAHILVAIDAFTKFIEVQAVPDTCASTCLEFLNYYCGRYGIPKTILTDGGPMFNNNLIKEASKVFKINLRRTTPEHSQGNALVERVNQTLQEKLAMANGLNTNWDVQIPAVMLAINTSRHTTTGYTPYELLFGRKLPIYNSEVTEEITPHDQHLKIIQKQLQDTRERAINNQAAAQERSRARYEKQHRNINYEIGDKVLIRIGGSRPYKLGNRFGGPMEIIQKSNDIYKLRNPETNKTFDRHVSVLKPYYGQPARSPSPTGSTASRASQLSLGILALATLFCVASGSHLFETANPAMWIRTDYLVDAGLMFYDIDLVIVNPCDEARTKMVTNYTKRVKRDDVKTYVTTPTDWLSGSLAYTPEMDQFISPTSRFVNAPEPLPTPQALAVEVSPTGEIKQENLQQQFHEADLQISECNKMLEEYWKRKANTINDIRLDDEKHSKALQARQFSRPIDRSERKKRSLLALIPALGFAKWIGGLAVEAAGVVISTVATNLIYSSVIQRDPDESRTLAMEKTLRRFKEENQIQRDIAESLVKHFEIQEERIKELVEKQEQDYNHLRRSQWVTSMITAEIREKGNHLQDIILAYRRGRVATSALSKLLSMDQIGFVPDSETIFFEIKTSDNGMRLQMKFAIMKPSDDTFVYQVKAFDMWDRVFNTNITEPPIYLTYKGPNLVLYNSTANCAIHVDRPIGPAIYERCDATGQGDAELENGWVPKVPQPQWKFYNKVQVIKTLPYNYVLCFRSTIQFRQQKHECPFEPIQLPSSEPFYTPTYGYRPDLTRRNITAEFAIEALHPSQLPKDSDHNNNQKKAYDSIMELKAQLAFLTEIQEQEIVIPKARAAVYGSSFGAMIMFALLIYCCYKIGIGRIIQCCKNLYTPGYHSPTNFNRQRNRASTQSGITLTKADEQELETLRRLRILEASSAPSGDGPLKPGDVAINPSAPDGGALRLSDRIYPSADLTVGR